MKRIILSLLTLGLCIAAEAYKPEQQIGKGMLGPVAHLALGPNNTICALEKSGKVIRFNSDGSVAGRIETGMANTTALVITSDGEFHIFATLTETKKVKMGARMRKVEIPVGVELGVFTADGKKLRTRRLDTLKSAQAAKIINGKLVVADLSARALVFMDAATFQETGRVKKGLRLCCGIFDFCEAPDNTVAVSNLGAFKVQRYSIDGKLLAEFGKRGRELNDFQGCCNPVSAAYLPDGRIVTVEKDPTRIKIYDAAGKQATAIEGIEELVKGCSFIPSAVDQAGNLYLAANTKGYIIKCSP